VARQILDILKRHGNLRFDSADSKEFALQEVADLDATDDDAAEAPTPKPPAAHPATRVSQAPSLTQSGADEDDDDAPPQVPGTKHDGD
jgi:hypothetical protein